MKYVKVREFLRGLIDDGLPSGSAIPSERALCDRFGVSRMTVRQAVDALVVEGLLERIQGRGTYVAHPKVDLQLRLTSFGDEMRRRGMTPGAIVLHAVRTGAPPHVAQALGLAPGEEVFSVRRVRLADGSPMALEESWLPVRLVPDLLDGGVPPPSLSGALAAKGLDPVWGEDTIQAVQLDAETAEHLGLAPGAPGLQIDRSIFSATRAVDYVRSIYRADRYSLWVPVSAPGPRLVPAARRPGGLRPVSRAPDAQRPTPDGTHGSTERTDGLA